MKIDNPKFHAALKDKGLRAFLFRKPERFGDAQIRLCVEVKSKYSDEVQTEYIDIDFAYGEDYGIDNYAATEHNSDMRFSFYENMYTNSPVLNPVLTFFRSIKKTSDVKFRIIANNNCDNYRKVGYTSHSLIGIIDGTRSYTLSTYFGPQDNIISPVKN